MKSLNQLDMRWARTVHLHAVLGLPLSVLALAYYLIDNKNMPTNL